MTAIRSLLAAWACLGVVAGCDGGNAGANWTKSGADSAAVARDYDDCSDIARTATRKEADIDQDIAATRGADAQRAFAVQTRTADMREKTNRSTDSIIESCMRQNGYYPTDNRPGGFKGLRNLFD